MNIPVQKWLSKSQLLVILIYFVWFSNCQITQKASYFCRSDANNANIANIEFGVVPKSDSIYRIYAYDASQQDTLSTTNRISTCFKDGTVTDPDRDRVSFSIAIDFSAASGHDCGAYVTGTTVKTIALLFRTQAYASLYTGEDVVYRIKCYSDDLTDAEIATPGYSGSEAVEVDLFEPNRGVSIRVRQESNDIPLTVVPLGERVYISLEFVPGQEKGFDTFGTDFIIGYLGNDLINTNLESSESLFLVVIPRYSVSTYVTVTSVNGSESRMSENQDVMVFDLPTELMGCSDGGEAEIADKGVVITSTHEVTVQVYNRETDTEDCYTAWPIDVLVTDYVAVSNPATNEISELMIAAPEDNVNVDLTLPAYTSLTVTLNGESKSAGEVLSFSLQSREVFHLSVSSAATAESVVGFKIHADKPVAVFSGKRADSGDHQAEQIPGLTKLGTRYVLTPADPIADGRSTTYIIQATADGDTLVTRYLGTSTFLRHLISKATSPPLTIDVVEPCELTSDNPILVAQIVNGPTGSEGYEPAMLIQPSVQQWTSHYSLYTRDRGARVTMVFPSETAANDLKLGFNGNSFGSAATPLVDVKGPSGYKFFSSRPLGSNTLFTLSSTDAITHFMPLAYATNDNQDTGLAYLPFGYRIPTTGECVTTIVAKQGDLIDNDCDFLIDEELVNFIDDDLDGKIDEDPVDAAEEFADVVGISPHTCQASGVANFLDVSKLRDITLDNGCADANPNNPFRPDAEFTQTGTAGGRKIYKSGAFSMAMFEDEDRVYIKCLFDHCLNESDTTCTTGICQQDPPGRRKREEDRTNVSSVVTSVQVVPRIAGTDPNANDRSGSEMDPITCLENTYFLVIFIVLILLVIVSFGTAVCFCCLFRQRRNEDKTRTRHGHHRKSF